MDIRALINNQGKCRVSGLFDVVCSCGVIDGETPFELKEADGRTTVKIDGDGFGVKAEIIEAGDVFIRRDTFTNTCGKSVYLSRFYSRFAEEAYKTDVYTQSSNWSNESAGGWQRLVTNVTAANNGVRTTAEAAPMACVWDAQAERGIVYHLIPNTAWKISVTKRAGFTDDYVTVVEMGIADERLCMEVLPGETVYLPEIIFYPTDNKNDMSCYKLQKYLNEAYPQRQLPAVFNSWFSSFDALNFDFFIAQADKAAELGLEYFVIDAGWFGQDGKSWGELIGDWRENPVGAFGGKMRELADYIRGKGMKFGLWLEPERALQNTRIVKEHPEYFLGKSVSRFLDFGNDEARSYITETVSDLIRRYDIAYIKFDFNDNLSFDNVNSSFYRYNLGHKRFIGELRRSFPGIYIENCASGGTRMDLFHLTYTDSVWFSDNQNPYQGIGILRNTVLRMRPSYLERWAALRSLEGFTPVYAEEHRTDRLVTVNEATWQGVEGVSMKYMRNFLAGGPLGITCDLCSLNERDFTELKEIVAHFKAEREFYRNAVCIPLTTTEGFTVLQYTDTDEARVIIQLFERENRQKEIRVYPKLKCNRNYGKITGDGLCEKGVVLQRNFSAANLKRTDSVEFIAE